MGRPIAAGTVVFDTWTLPGQMRRTQCGGPVMTIHIGAQLGEIAETVLLPGDPLRAQWAAETFLEDVACVNRVRGMLGFTGT